MKKLIFISCFLFSLFSLQAQHYFNADNSTSFNVSVQAEASDMINDGRYFDNNLNAQTEDIGAGVMIGIAIEQFSDLDAVLEGIEISNTSLQALSNQSDTWFEWLIETHNGREYLVLKLKDAIPTLSGGCSSTTWSCSHPEDATNYACTDITFNSTSPSYTISLCFYTPPSETLRITAVDGTDFGSAAAFAEPTESKDFTAEGGSGDAFTWSISRNPENFTIEGDGREVSITFQPNSCGPDNGSYTLRVENTNDSNESDDINITASVNDERCNQVTKNPVDIVFVVDVSGSMGWDAKCLGCEDDPELACPEGSKLEVFKKRFDQLIDDLVSTSSISDQNRYGLVTFNDVATPFGTRLYRINHEFDNTPPWRKQLKERLGINGNIPADGNTSIGDGLKKAFELLKTNDIGNEKHIILFSNGEQNTNPLVKKSNGPPLKYYVDVQDGDGEYDTDYLEEECFEVKSRKDDGNDIILLDEQGATQDDVELTFITFNNPKSCYISLLENTTKDDLYEVKGICKVPELIALKVFKEQESSPRVFYLEGGNESSVIATEQIPVVDDVDKLVFSIGTFGNSDLEIQELRKDGVPITNGVTTYASPEAPHTIATVVKDTSGSSLIGEYEVQFKSDTPRFTYDIKGILDDEGLRYSTAAGHANQEAGEDIKLGVHLYISSNPPIPVTNADVYAVIYRPIYSLGKELSQARLSGEYVSSRKMRKKRSFLDLPFEIRKADISGGEGVVSNITLPSIYIENNNNAKWVRLHEVLPPENANVNFDEDGGLSIGQKKYVTALYSTDLGNKLGKVAVEKIKLIEKGNGVYVGVFDKTDKMGTYEVGFEIGGAHQHENVGGRFFREEAKTVNVAFGEADFKKSKVHVQAENIYILSLQPQDIYGNCLGPANAHEIEVVTNVGVARAPIDYLNGKYVVRLQGTQLGRKPYLSLRVKDYVIYRGRLSKLLKKFKFTALGGLTAPTDGLGDLFSDPSYVGEGKLGFRICNHLFLQAEGGYYQATNPSDGSEPNIYGGGLGLQYNIPIGFGTGWNFYFDATGTQYNFDGGGWEWGGNGGVGITTTLTPNLAAVLEGTYYRVFMQPDDFDFLGINLGLRVSF